MGRPPKKYHFSTSYRYDDFACDWDAIEKTLGYSLSSSARPKILACTKQFLSAASAERNAPLLYEWRSGSKKKAMRSAAAARLDRIRSHARALLNILNEVGDYTADKPELAADDLIGMSCDRPELGGTAAPPKARFCTLRLAKILDSFVTACDVANQDLKIYKSSNCFKDGVAWNEWVATIATIVKSDGHRVSTAMYRGKPSRSELPDFVRLIRALNNRIPDGLAPEHPTNEALAKAVARALDS